MLPPLLVVKNGSTDPGVASSDGDYEDWFRASLEEGPARIEIAPADGPLPDPGRYGGVILTGSPSSVRDEAPWMEPLARWTLEAADRGVPVLAVCFGHQLIGEALGGRVEQNPAGPELGTYEVELTRAGASDPLFEGLPRRILVNQTHHDALVVTPPPEKATLLATSERCAWQAFAVGSQLRAVQFHPELRAETLRRLLEARGTPGEVRDTPHGARLLRNWDEHFVRGRSEEGRR